MPKVSVIVPSFNHGRFIERRLTSIFNQTFKDVDVIVIDDCSQDDTIQIVERLTHGTNAKLLRNDINSGTPFAQWNLGASIAKGEYLWIAESDDYASERFLERLVALLDAHPEVGMAYCQSYVVDENNEILGLSSDYVWCPPGDQGRWISDYIMKGKQEINERLCLSNTIPNASAVLLRRHLFQQIGGASTSLKLCGDWLTWIRILEHCSLGYVSEPLNYWRYPHPTSARVICSTNKRYVDELVVIAKEALAASGYSEAVKFKVVLSVCRGWLLAAWQARDAKLLLNINKYLSLCRELQKQPAPILLSYIVYAAIHGASVAVQKCAERMMARFIRRQEAAE